MGKGEDVYLRHDTLNGCHLKLSMYASGSEFTYAVKDERKLNPMTGCTLFQVLPNCEQEQQ